MKTILLRLLFFVCGALPLCAFEWPGGTMTVNVTCNGSMVFEGDVPSSPWGSVAFLNNPVLQLKDAGNAVVAQSVITGVAADWNDGGVRTAVVSFTVPAGTYTLVGQQGTRLQLIAGDGWMGLTLTFGPIADPAGANVAPTISWTSAPVTVASGASYVVSAHGHDADGNLTQVNIWKNGVPFAFAGGGNGTDGDSSNSSADTGPQTITYTAQAVDALGASSPVITQTVTVSAAPPSTFTLVTSADTGGTVTGGGTFANGTWATISATPDALHDFVGWSGDAAGMAMPVGVLMDADKTVHAAFAPKLFPLVTTVTSGGSVTPGGSYSYGTSVTVAATADATHYFVNWSGDAAGTVPSLSLVITGPTSVQANFAPKLPQTLTFPAPGDRPAGVPPFAPGATASSGLAVSYTVLSGPATIVGAEVKVNGAGPIVVEASQPGDALYLPAPPVTQAFNGLALTIVKVTPTGRVKLGTRTTRQSGNFLIQAP